MSTPDFTYYLTIDAVETQVYPYGDWSLKVAKAEEDFPYCRDYRIKFDGEFVFAGDDYDLLTGIDCCDKVDLRIDCDGENYWFGYFAYPYDLDWDEDRCEIKGTPKPLDKYYYFDLYSDKEAQLVFTDNLASPSNYVDGILDADITWLSDCVPCELIFDVIDRMLGDVIPLACGFDLKSAFLKDDDATDGQFPDGSYPVPSGKSYVTGYDNKMKYSVMAMAKDLCNPTVGTFVDLPYWTWDDLMEKLHKAFNTWWYIDENGDVRFEHIYFWELYFSTSYDLTTIDTGRWILNTNKYSFTANEMPKEEQWNWSEHLYNFVEEKFTYYDCFLPGKTKYIKEYDVSNLTTDIEYILPGANNFATNPDSCDDISDDTYMWLRCVDESDVSDPPYNNRPAGWCADWVVWWDRYLIDSNNHVNAHMSPANLLANYWMHDRPFWDGYMTQMAQSVTFDSVWKTLKQEELSFPVCCSDPAEVLVTCTSENPEDLYEFGIDFNETITTQYGAGELYTGSIKDSMLTLELVFEDLCDEGTPTEWTNPSEL